MSRARSGLEFPENTLMLGMTVAASLLASSTPSRARKTKRGSFARAWGEGRYDIVLVHVCI